jgi:small-conductance mechanosensitive channel
MADIYSDLHQNILDNFNEAGVEIMSPTYFAFRNGQGSTIPEAAVSNNGNGQRPRQKEDRISYSRFREKTQPLGSR